MINLKCTLNIWRRKTENYFKSMDYSIYYTLCIIYMPVWAEGVINNILKFV